MNFITKLLISTLLVFVLANFLPGIQIDNLISALTVAVVLGLLNTFLKPILVLLTIPVTLFTFGFFLLIINAFMILICDHLITGFQVSGFLTALIFGVLLSISQSILNKIAVPKK